MTQQTRSGSTRTPSPHASREGRPGHAARADERRFRARPAGDLHRRREPIRRGRETVRDNATTTASRLLPELSISTRSCGFCRSLRGCGSDTQARRSRSRRAAGARTARAADARTFPRSPSARSLPWERATGRRLQPDPRGRGARPLAAGIGTALPAAGTRARRATLDPQRTTRPRSRELDQYDAKCRRQRLDLMSYRAERLRLHQLVLARSRPRTGRVERPRGSRGLRTIRRHRRARPRHEPRARRLGSQRRARRRRPPAGGEAASARASSRPGGRGPTRAAGDRGASARRRREVDRPLQPQPPRPQACCAGVCLGRPRVGQTVAGADGPSPRRRVILDPRAARPSSSGSRRAASCAIASRCRRAGPARLTDQGLSPDAAARAADRRAARHRKTGAKALRAACGAGHDVRRPGPGSAQVMAPRRRSRSRRGRGGRGRADPPAIRLRLHASTERTAAPPSRARSFSASFSARHGPDAGQAVPACLRVRGPRIDPPADGVDDHAQTLPPWTGGRACSPAKRTPAPADGCGDGGGRSRRGAARVHRRRVDARRSPQRWQAAAGSAKRSSGCPDGFRASSICARRSRGLEGGPSGAALRERSASLISW